MPRPAVDVIVPFRGTVADLEHLRDRLRCLELAPADTVLVVDNTPRRESRPSTGEGDVPVVRGTDRATPGYARNLGAAGGSGEWLLFLDADTESFDQLLDRYFAPAPRATTALLAGGLRDAVVPRDGAVAARYAYLRQSTGKDDTLRFGRWAYPKTANAAFRRRAFEAVGGFREDIRAAEDADLAFRLAATGWEVEHREHAAVVHRSRPTVRAFAVQKAMHGAGGAWLDREYPGSFPPRRRPGLIWWGIRVAVGRLVAAARRRDRDRAILALLEPLDLIAWELGRSLPNQRPLSFPWSRIPFLREEIR